MLRLLIPLVLARFSIATLLAVVTASLPAQPPSPGFHALRGVVHDSLTGAPLREALVQLVVDTSAEATPAAVRAVLSDSLGRFHFDSIPTGRYRLGFFHDLLDGTGIAPVVQMLEIPRDLPRGDPLVLASPSAATMRRALCADTSGGTAMGRMRHAAHGTARDGGTVITEWLEVTLSPRGLTRRPQRRLHPVEAGGWYVACGLPRAGAVLLSATGGTDSTERVEHAMPLDGLLRQDLFLPSPGDTTRLLIQGLVQRAGDGRPISGALIQVGATGSVTPSTTRSDADGRWRLTTGALGSRTLEIKAVGFYPVQQPIAMAPEAPDVTAPIRTALTSMKAVLDTVKVMARYDRYRIATEFTERRRSGVGRYLTANQIAGRQVLVVSDLFTVMPGVYVERDSTGMPVLLMRGLFADRCVPAIFVNGFQMQGFDAQALDTFIHPEELLGVEVYTESTVPPQFSPGMSGCGSLVFWTR